MAVRPYFRRSRCPKRRKLLRRMAQRYRSGEPCLTTEVVTTSVTWHSRTNSAACWMNKRQKSSLHLSLQTLRIGSSPVHFLPCLGASPGNVCDQCSGSIQLIRTTQAPRTPLVGPLWWQSPHNGPKKKRLDGYGPPNHPHLNGYLYPYLYKIPQIMSVNKCTT